MLGTLISYGAVKAMEISDFEACGCKKTYPVKIFTGLTAYWIEKQWK